MKHKNFLLIGTVIASLVISMGFGVKSAYATTGCFLDTVGNFYETAICWMKDNGISNGTGGGNYSPNANVTRGQMASFMQKQAEIPPSTGDIYVSAGFANWHPFNSTDPLAYTYFSSQTQVTRSAAGSSFLSVNPDVPTVLYGRSLIFKGVQFCFDTFASTTLSYIEVNTYSHTTGSLGRNLRLSDPTARTGNHCQLYTLPSPITLGANEGVNFFIQVNWGVASSQFAIGRTTFIFAPTTTLAATPAVPQPLGNELVSPSSSMPDTSAPQK
jgi:hypothetical protein